MKFVNSKNGPVNSQQDLKVMLERLPFSDCSNVNMPKVNTKSKQKINATNDSQKLNFKKKGKKNQTIKHNPQSNDVEQSKKASTKRISSVSSTNSTDQFLPSDNKISLLPPIPTVRGTNANEDESRDPSQSEVNKKEQNLNSKMSPKSAKSINHTGTNYHKSYQLKKNVQEPENDKATCPKVILQNCNARQSTPLVNRLRKGSVKKYLESTVEDSILEPTMQNLNNSNKPKVLIYNQPILLNTKTNLKDPYALDIIDSQQVKQKKKNLNDSSKFNKTMHNILEKIEKKERKQANKRKVIKTVGPTYEESIQKVLKRVLTKVHQHKGLPVTIDVDKEDVSMAKESTMIKENAKNLSSTTNHEPTSLRQMSKNLSRIEDNVCGCDNRNSTGKSTISKNLSNPKESESTLQEKSNNRSQYYEVERFCDFDNRPRAQHCSVHVDHNSSLHSFEISMHSLPSTSRIQNENSKIIINRQSNANSTINILSDISIGNTKNTSLSVPSNISLSTIKTQQGTNLVNANPIEKSHNLWREFQGENPVFNDQSLSSIEFGVDFDDYIEESEDEDDQFFGFCEETDTKPEKVQRFSHKTKLQPWRFQGYFRRNPYMLKIKKNGLPCQQQEMVIDYNFVKRIEALSSNKPPEPPRSKSPVQTSMLDYVESTQDHPDQPTHPSLFDYEEFNVVKPARKILGVIHDNQQVVSTPKRAVHTLVASPNVSIIPRLGDEENSPLSNNRPLQKKYRRKSIEEEKADKEESGLDGGILPSILDQDYEEVQEAEINLFEDVGKEKIVDFSITVPNIKYEKKKRKKRQISEGSDDEEKKKPKKKKNLMTKAEEAAFEAWASTTNAMFAEVDKHDLTIE